MHRLLHQLGNKCLIEDFIQFKFLVGLLKQLFNQDQNLLQDLYPVGIKALKDETKIEPQNRINKPPVVLIQHSESRQQIEIADPLVTKFFDTRGTPEHFFGQNVELLLEDLLDGECLSGSCYTRFAGFGLNERFNLLQSCKFFYFLFCIGWNLLFYCHFLLLLFLFLLSLFLFFIGLFRCIFAQILILVQDFQAVLL